MRERKKRKRESKIWVNLYNMDTQATANCRRYSSKGQKVIVLSTSSNLQKRTVRPKIREKDHGKCHTLSKSTRCSQISALSCCTDRGEDNICQGIIKYLLWRGLADFVSGKLVSFVRNSAKARDTLVKIVRRALQNIHHTDVHIQT